MTFLKPNKFPDLNNIFYYWKRNNWMLRPGSYFGRYRDISIDRPIFLLGVQCSGLTLVSRILRRHPSVVSITGNWRYWSGADEMHTVLGPILPAELTGTRYKIPHPKHPLYTPPRSWTYACDELLPYYRKTTNDATPELKTKIERILRMISARHSPYKENVRFTDKSQVYTVRVSLLHELLREHDPKFILIVMNPYILCYKAAEGKAADMRRFRNKLSFEKRLNICAQHWANSMMCALEDKSENMKVVKFEDILQDPAASIKDICGFVGIDFKDYMLPQPHHQIPYGSRFQDRWYPLDTQRNREYLQKIKSHELDILESRCKELAQRFGYCFI